MNKTEITLWDFNYLEYLFSYYLICGYFFTAYCTFFCYMVSILMKRY